MSRPVGFLALVAEIACVAVVLGILWTRNHPWWTLAVAVVFGYDFGVIRNKALGTHTPSES